MVDDVAGDVLLGARELVEALLDVLGEALLLRGGLGRGLGHGRPFRRASSFPFRSGWMISAMTLEQALRLTNRNMIAFDLVLGTGAIVAPEVTLRVLGHDEPSPDAARLFQRSGPVWLTFAAAHAVAAPPRRAARLVGAGLAARDRDRDRRALGRSPAISRPGAKAGLRLAGVANLAMAAGFAWLSRGAEVADVAGLPSIRWSLRGLNDEGDEAWLIRGVSRKLYRCPGCHGEIEIGAEHTIVQYVQRLGGTEHHHWHRRCAEELLIPDAAQRAGGSRPASPRSRSSRRAAGSGPGSAAASVTPTARAARALRADRPHLRQLGPGPAAARRRRLRPARPGPRDPGPRQRRLARPRAAASRSSRWSLARAGRSRATGLIGEVFYTGVVSIALTHPHGGKPPSLREVARHDQLRAADRRRPDLRRCSSRSAWSPSSSRACSSTSTSGWRRRSSRSSSHGVRDAFARSVAPRPRPLLARPLGPGPDRDRRRRGDAASPPTSPPACSAARCSPSGSPTPLTNIVLTPFYAVAAVLLTLDLIAARDGERPRLHSPRPRA